MRLPSHLIFLLCFSVFSFANLVKANRIQDVPDFHVGVVLDMDSEVGKVGWNCIELALTDFYAIHHNYKTRLIVTLRDSKGDNVQASLAVIDLLQNVGVQAIIGPQTSRQTDFAVDLGDKAHVPIISFSATSPSLSFQTPYFVRASASDSSQVKAITAIIQSFKWREVVTIYEDSDFGKSIIPFLVDALQVEQVTVPYKSVIPLLATDDKIRVQLYKLMIKHCRVFIVHMSHTLASRFFLLAKELGMSEGYVWIVTDGLMNFFDSIDSTVSTSMQGVLGVKPYIRSSPELDNFTKRWKKKFHQELNIYGLWAYDTIWTLAMAAERVGPTKSFLQNTRTTDELINLSTFRTSKIGRELLDVLSKIRFIGLSGDIYFINRQLQSETYQILNVIGRKGQEVGFWTSEHGLQEELNWRRDEKYTASMTSLRGIIWPGGLRTVPNGWMIPASAKKLRVGFTVRDGFDEFVKVTRDIITNKTTIGGFSIDVFNLAMAELPYPIAYEFEQFTNADGSISGNNSEMIYQVYRKKYDIALGDTTITANRSSHADFTLPYAEGGVAMVVPVKEDKKGTWIFMKPLTKDLWLVSGAFCILTGFVIWLLEHRVNEAFRGPPSQHVPLILWFPLSTLVFAHRERIVSNMTRFAVIIWIFVVFILTSSYTASLSSYLTVQRLQPTVTSIEELIKSGAFVGHQTGSFIPNLLKDLKFEESKLKSFVSKDDIDEALQNGSQNGGIDAFFALVPYTKLLIGHYCNRYTTVGPISNTEGFGIAFPRGSPLVADVSRAILKVLESSKMKELQRSLFGNHTICSASENNVISNSLSFDSFRGLFLITGTVSGVALLVFLIVFLYKNKQVLSAANPNRAIWPKIKTILKQFDEKDLSSYRFRRERSAEIRHVGASPSFTSVSEVKGIEASPSPTDVSELKDIEASQSPTDLLEVRDIEASPSFTDHSPSRGMICNSRSEY